MQRTDRLVSWRSDRGGSPEETGFTLIEVLMTITIMGVVAVGLLTGLGTVLIGSDRTRKTADVGTAVIKVADAVLDEAQFPYSTACPANGYAVGSTFASLSFPGMKITGAQVRVTNLEWWDGTAYTTTCPSTAPAPFDPLRLQRITIEARTDDGRGSRTLQFVKRG